MYNCAMWFRPMWFWLRYLHSHDGDHSTPSLLCNPKDAAHSSYLSFFRINSPPGLWLSPPSDPEENLQHHAILGTMTRLGCRSLYQSTWKVWAWTAVHLAPSAFLDSADGSLKLVHNILPARLLHTPYQERVETLHHWGNWSGRCIAPSTSVL